MNKEFLLEMALYRSKEVGLQLFVVSFDAGGAVVFILGDMVLGHGIQIRRRGYF